MASTLGAIAARGRTAIVDTAGGVASRTLDAVVPAVANAILDRIDLTELVRRRVDIDAVISDADLDAIVARLDLVSLTQDVIDAIDLPQLVRDSSGGVTSVVVDDVRVRSRDADHSLARGIDRLLHRTKQPAPIVPGA